MSKKKIIILIAYKRAEKTKKVLKAIRSLKLIEEFQLLVVRQDGCDQVKAIVEAINWINVIHYVTSYTETSTPKFCINENIRFGLTKSFELHGASYVVVVEDDIILGYDFLEFCNQMHERYRQNKSFRAINAFSKEEYLEENLFKYGTFRYGIGWGWSINSEIWYRLKKYWPSQLDEHFDALIEPWIKGGFVVMPMCSRCENIGWGDGNHSATEKDDPIYTDLSKSFVGTLEFNTKKFEISNTCQYTWREDCKRYKKINFNYLLKYYKYKIHHLFRYKFKKWHSNFKNKMKKE
jgi:hypothetical protein